MWVYDIIWALKKITETQASMCWVTFCSVISLLLFVLRCATVRWDSRRVRVRAGLTPGLSYIGVTLRWRWKVAGLKYLPVFWGTDICPTRIRDHMCEVIQEVQDALRARGREDGIVGQHEDYWESLSLKLLSFLELWVYVSLSSLAVFSQSSLLSVSVSVSLMCVCDQPKWAMGAMCPWLEMYLPQQETSLLYRR